MMNSTLQQNLRNEHLKILLSQIGINKNRNQYMNDRISIDIQDSFDLIQQDESCYNIFDDGTSQNISINQTSPEEMIIIDCKVKFNVRKRSNGSVANKSKKIKKESQNLDKQTKIRSSIDPKNLPKQLGNNFRKFAQQYNVELSPAITKFINKKQPTKQANYILDDFRKLCQDKIGQQLFTYYIHNQAILDLINSRKVEDPISHLKFLAIYASGAQSPSEWNSHHNQIKYPGQVHKGVNNK